MFKGMEYVYEVYKEKSFSKAAQNLYISQPSLSATIKKIEERIGFPLFDRSTTPIQLTPYGKEYVKCIEKIIDIQNGFENFLNNMDELCTGNIAIGGSNLFASYILPPIITDFRESFPQVSIHMVEANTALLEQQLFSGTLDLVIDNYEFNESIYSKHKYCNEHLILAVPQKFEVNKSAKEYQLTSNDIIQGKHLDPVTPSVPLELFKDEPFLFLRSGNDTRKRAEKICQHHNFSPNIILKLDQLVTSYNLTCYGMGISFLSDTLIKHTKSDSDVVYYKLEEDNTSRNVYFYTKKGKYLTRAMEEFLKIAIPKNL
ncbi:LysR family transcriptional regulator [uncultured Clostridium sp.]|uniref:LysR family transcriptional regulator n=1 Tax=uncultured Clostridium sp. TaxID=59620 RepID=UPI0028EC6ED6|nr:LysR family transcriptional regulator [uncultured Clostridium sp.]